MPAETGQRLSLRDAARLIYRVERPTPEQIERVRQHILQRELVGDQRGTTSTAVADFLARAATARQRDARRDAPTDGRQVEQLDHVYHETLKSYFLTIIFRRKMRGTSIRFQRAVVVGQVLLLCFALLTIIFCVRAAFPPLAPERAAVLAWLETHAPKSRINQWHPPSVDEEGQTRMRVEYHYTTDRGKGVDTDRVFVISGGQVVGVQSEW
jgi:hypothetical protein